MAKKAMNLPPLPPAKPPSPSPLHPAKEPLVSQENTVKEPTTQSKEPPVSQETKTAEVRLARCRTNFPAYITTQSRVIRPGEQVPIIVDDWVEAQLKAGTNFELVDG